jgi:hypothetical protein
MQFYNFYYAIFSTIPYRFLQKVKMFFILLLIHLFLKVDKILLQYQRIQFTISEYLEITDIIGKILFILYLKFYNSYYLRIKFKKED